MDHRLPTVARRALVWALAIAAIGPAGAVATPDSDALDAARERVDRTSAELAAARSRAEGLGGEELAALRRIEARLEAQKAELVRLEAALSAQVAAADDEADDDAEDSAPVADDATDPVGAADGPLVVLSDAPSPTATGTLGGVHAGEIVPVVSGAQAGEASAIDGYLASKASPLTGLGAAFVAEARAAGVDPRFLVAIAGAETAFGTYGPSQAIHNPFGMGPGIVYGSWSEAVAAAARNLGGPIYLGAGRVTIVAIRDRWAPAGVANDPTGLNSNWVRNVSTYYAEQGGDPSLPVAILPDGVTPVVTPTPGVVVGGLPVRVPEIGASGMGPNAAQEALTALGTRAGGDRREGPAALIRRAYAAHGVDVPGGLAAQAAAGRAIEPTDLANGDPLFFSDASGTIVDGGLYVGGGQFVHAPRGDAVRLSSLYDPAYATAYAGARRY